MQSKALVLTTAVALIVSNTAAADSGWYASVSAGFANRTDSNNAGAFSSNFTTGEGTTIPAGTVVPAGTQLGWETQFDDGYAIAPAVGYAFGNGYRVEFEIPFINNDVDSHSGVAVGGGVIDAEDAGVLITGSGNLGVSVGEVVSDGQGEGEIVAYMLNAYYDFSLGNAFTPYLGAGIGYANSDVEFQPSGIPVGDGDDTGFAWQVKAGVSYALSDTAHLFGEYRYFTQDDASIDLSVLPAGLDVENEFHVFAAGFRYHF